MKLLISINGQIREYSPDPNLGIISVGRGDGNDIILEGEKGASRNHLTLERTVDGWKLVDQMSANGTAVNGEKVNFTFIKDNDLIQIGSTTIRVAGLSGAGSPRPAPVRRAHAPKPVRRAAELPAGAPIPKRQSPAAALVAVAVIVLVLGVGGYLMFAGSGSTTSPEVADAHIQTPRQASMTDDEKAALALAREVAGGSESNIEKYRRLESIQKTLQSNLAGKRGSKALSDIGELKTVVIAALDAEVNQRVEADLLGAQQDAEQNEFVSAMGRLDGLEAWFKSDDLLAGFAGANRNRIAKARQGLETENSTYLAKCYDQMRKYTDQGRYDDALAVCDDLLHRAWLDARDRELYEIERRKIEALKKDGTTEDPVVEAPAKVPGVLDKVKKDEGRLPGKNPLLQDGARSEQKLLAALQARLVAAARSKSLTSELFEWKGKKARIRGADEKKLSLEVSSIDKKTREELVYRTSAKWVDVLPEDMLQLYDRTPGLTDEDRLALVIYCFDHGFMDEAARRACALWKLRNDWKEGIDTLIAGKRRITIPSEGFVEYEDALVTPAEKENAIFYAGLRGVLERFEKGIGSKDRTKAADAEKAFSELLEMGERAVKPSIEILQGVLDKELGNAKRATGLMAADKTRMDGLLAELDRRREYALELIMDTERYPYPYGPNQAEVQADVDERVAAVREIWNDPAKFSGQTNPEFDAIMGKVRSIAERMVQIDPEQKYFKQTPDQTVEYISNIANEALSIRNYTGDDIGRQELFNTNTRVLKYNEEFPTGEGHADAQSREQVRITNEYRIMFGRVALKINDKLYWAAHHHSRYCVEHNGGQIAHVIPGEPRGEGPGDRMKYEGYPAGGGENIHMNSMGPTAQSSHDSWCHSSGHHRNILAPGWRVLGSARWKTIWTQCFGAVDEGEGNTVSKGGQ